MPRTSRNTPVRVTIAVAATLAAAFATVGPGPAGAETAPTGVTDTIFMKDVNGLPKFVGPTTVTLGDELKVVNLSNPKRVGPHTISLVTQGSLPKTKSARQRCFTPNHICKAIANWHGAKGEGPPTINPAKAGAEGWDTEGSLTRKGDSWFTGKKGQSFEQQVTVDVSAGPRRIYFICAVHPWMQGSVKVVPSTAGQ